MSSEPPFVTPEDVFEEQDLFTRLENALEQALGIDSDDLEADDTLQAAIAFNTAQIIQLQQRQADLLGELTGVEPDIEVIVENITPEVTLPKDTDFTLGDLQVQLDTKELKQAFRESLIEAEGAVNRRQIYDVDVAGTNDNVLTGGFKPVSGSNYFRVGVVLDTATTFRLRVEPPDDPNYTTIFNNGADLGTDEFFEFEFDADPEAEHNFRLGGSATVRYLRLQEIFVE